jgi:hypothetical protein
VVLAVISVGLLHWGLPLQLRFGPDWLLIVLLVALVVPAQLTLREGNIKANAVLGYSIAIVLTLYLSISVGLLVRALVLHTGLAPWRILLSAAMLWVCNVLIFSIWYWRIDAGGPAKRAQQDHHSHGAFLFPEMQVDDVILKRMGRYPWKPQYLDYLFLAFNTSSALSPADTLPVDRAAKGLMMIQATISLSLIGMVAARAVNVL